MMSNIKDVGAAEQRPYKEKRGSSDAEPCRDGSASKALQLKIFQGVAGNARTLFT